MRMAAPIVRQLTRINIDVRRVNQAVKKICAASLKERLARGNPTGIARIASDRFASARACSDRFSSTRERDARQNRRRALRGSHRTCVSMEVRQRPSLPLSRSFTACGFALPPDAFIA
jgi:hypothetical protein